MRKIYSLNIKKRISILGLLIALVLVFSNIIYAGEQNCDCIILLIDKSLAKQLVQERIDIWEIEITGGITLRLKNE